MPLDGGVIAVIYRFTLFIWIAFLRIIRIVVMRYNKLIWNHSNRFSIQKTHYFNPSFSSRALQGTKYALYMFSPSFALRNCAECDSHIAVTGCKSICPFYVVYWMTVSYRCHANLLRDFLLHTYFVLYFTFACCGFVNTHTHIHTHTHTYTYIYIYVWIFEHVNALSDSMKRMGVC